MPQLEDLTVDWVSFVPRAAVRDPQDTSEPRRFLLYKREGVTTPDERSSMSDDTDLRAALEKAERETKEAEDARDVAVEAQTKAETDAKEAQDALAKAVSGDGGSESEDNDGDDLKSKAAKMKKADLSPEVRAIVEKAEQDAADAKSEIKKAQDSAAEAHELAKAERDTRVTREFIVKADSFRALPVEAEKFGPVLKSISEKLTKEEAEELDRVLKAADEQIVKGEVFGEYGSSSGAAGAPSDAYDALTRKAEELRKSDSKLSPEEALAKAMEDNPELERQYASENR